MVMVISNCPQLYLRMYTFASNGNIIVMELFQSQSSCNGNWYCFAI